MEKTNLRSNPNKSCGWRDIEMSWDGDFCKTGLETVWPDGQPGEGHQVHGVGEGQDDGPVLVRPQRVHGSLLVRDLDTKGARSGTTTNHEVGVRLVSTKDQVFDHHSLTVQSNHIPTEDSPAFHWPQNQRLGNIHLGCLCHQHSTNHFLWKQNISKTVVMDDGTNAQIFNPNPVTWSLELDNELDNKSAKNGSRVMNCNIFGP